jgi:hypothetical protein
MAIHTVPASAAPVTRSDLIRRFYATRKAWAHADHSDLRADRIHDFARAWAELDADEEQQRMHREKRAIALQMKEAA